jgi:DNA replication and repair protein RecF
VQTEAPLETPATREEPGALRRLRLARFRSLAPTDWHPAGGWNLVHGANGSGKSSLLEALYLVATGKSFRTANLSECCSRSGPGEAGFLVRAEVEREGSWDLAVVFSEGSRSLSLQDKPSALAAHLALLPVVVWSEAERELVAGPAAARRRFLDRAALLLQPARLAEHAELHRVLAQKRHLLAGNARAGRHAGAAELTAWNELLAPLIARRAQARAELVQRLGGAATALLAAHGADLPPLELTYQPSPPEAPEGSAAVAAALDRAVARERERGQPLLGPQRDRVEIAMDAAAARRFASAGERKVVALALLAGLTSLLVAAGRGPLVLLDDLDAELDRSRLALAAALFAGQAQTIATTSRPELFGASPSGPRWGLAKGVLGPG